MKEAGSEDILDRVFGPEGEALQALGGLPEGHSWQPVAQPNTGEIVMVPMPDKPVLRNNQPSDEDEIKFVMGTE